MEYGKRMALGRKLRHWCQPEGNSVMFISKKNPCLILSQRATVIQCTAVRCVTVT